MSASTTIHQFSVNDLNGASVSLEKYKGKVLLIVNTASKCGFTPQLEGMTELYKELQGEPFEILAFPSNDFAGQEPLEGAEIQQFCQLKYEAAYPIFDKVHVKGKEAHELFKFLGDKNLNGSVNGQPKWNFHKYLVDKEGKVIDFFYTMTKPTAGRLKRAIKRLL